MDTGRWTVTALVALLVALVPGAVRLLPEHRDLDRALALVPASALRDPQAAGVVPAGATPIVPPPAVMTGEVAPALPAPEPYAGARGGYGEVFALVVGIDDYPGRGSDLRWAGADADAVDAALAGFGVPAENRVVLRDGQAHRADLVAAVEALVERAGPGTTTVLAYAGHVRKLDPDTEAIVTADGGLLTDVELAGLLAPARSERLWVLMASCYAGGFSEVLAPGRILTGAADQDSFAYESSEVGGSYLVHHLVREAWLQGHAGPSVEEAFAYAHARLEQGPGRGAVQVDLVDGPLVLGSGVVPSPSAAPPPGPDPAAPAPSSAPPPPPDDTGRPGQTQAPPPTTQPERDCSLLVFC